MVATSEPALADETAMRVVPGPEGLEHTWQAEFPRRTACCRCPGEARHAFTAIEEGGSKGPHIHDMHPNVEHDRWPHDVVAVAVYFCTECLETTALYNQG